MPSFHSHCLYRPLDTWPFWGCPCMARDANISVSSSSAPQGERWVPLETGSLYQTGEQVTSIACYRCAFSKSRSKVGGSATLGTAHKCFAVGAPYGPCLWRIPRPGRTCGSDAADPHADSRELMGFRPRSLLLCWFLRWFLLLLCQLLLWLSLLGKKLVSFKSFCKEMNDSCLLNSPKRDITIFQRTSELGRRFLN